MARHFHSQIESRFHSLVETPFHQRLKTDYWAYWKCEEADQDGSGAPILSPVVRDEVGLADFVTLVNGGVHSDTGRMNNGFDMGYFLSPFVLDRMVIRTRPTTRFNFEDHDFTVRLWIKLDSSGPSGVEIIHTESNTIWELWVEDDMTNVRTPLWTVTAEDLSVYEVRGPTLAQGRWYRLVAWYEHGVEIGLKIDDAGSPGETTVTAAATAGIRHRPAQYIEIGPSELSALHEGHHILDEIAIWDRVLTAGELTADWNAGAGVTF